MERSSGRAGLQAGGWVLVEARLQGGAPWGFTLQGGLEYGEPLIISRVEEGGKASGMQRPLLVGDELIIINEVELSGYRQEAISLVKGSYKTLELTVRRECYPGYFEESGPLPPSLMAPPPPLHPAPPPPPLHPPPPPQQQQDHSRTCSAGGVRLRIKNRHSDPASRPHSWHSTKLGEGQQDSGLKELPQGGMGSAWHHDYHASASITDLSAGFDSGGSYLRKSPDQYSSRGSMESLDPPQSSHHHPGTQHHHHIHTGPHPAYSSCHQLSSARSSNSIDHLHSKRDSAYSSFSTSSSIPEYLASAPSSSPERSYSLETVPQRGGGSGEMQQADIRYVRTVYDAQQGLSQEHELSSASAAVLRNSESRGGGGTRAGLSRELQGSAGGVCYRGNSSSSSSSSGGSSSSGVPATNRHSVGPIWGQTSRSSYESLKGAPAPPQRSDSYAAIRGHERPNSWSSLDHARSLRSLHKGSWHHSSGSVASAKGSYVAEGQLHTVIEKSPESSPTTKPRQGGAFPQAPPSPGPAPGPPGIAPQSGRLMLPTGVYPVPQPEPHYAQMPSSGPGSGSVGVYPALAKESSRQQQQQGPQGIGGRAEGVMEAWRDGGMTPMENGYQNNPSSSSNCHSSFSSVSATSTQLRTQAQEADRPQQEEGNYGQYRTHLNAAGEGTDVRPQTPQNHQGSRRQCIQGPQAQTNQGPHNQILHGHNQDFQDPQTQSTYGYSPPTTQSMGPERRDPFTPVQPKGERSRTMDQPSIHPEPMVSARVAQGQMAATPTTYQTIHPHPNPHPHHHPSLRRHSDSAAPQHYQHWDPKEREHPLTRLEIALVEVQRGASPDGAVTSSSSQGNSSYGDSNQVNNSNQGTNRSLSVLEKVSRFERHERGGKQRSHKTSQQKNQPHEKGRSSPCGAEDLRHMLERSTSGCKAHRTMSYRGGDHRQHRNSEDPSSALQRSRSTYQLSESEEGNRSPEFPWRQDLQQLLGSIQDASIQDASFSRTYRDSLKDAQSKVLRSTSFRRRDLNSSVSPPPPTSSSHNHQPSPVPSMHHSLEKKGPKTMPKPHGLVLAPAPRSSPPPPPPLTSPHTPKERHMVGPDAGGPSPPALPSVPPVGPPLTRIGGRKRLTAEQKKRSYSEPENMHEVGVSDPETIALFRRGGETSVADRRRMFELAASRSVGGGASAATRPELRQLQQDALAEYVERKRGRKREEGGQRPHSVYQPEVYNQTVFSSYPDTISLSSTSSLFSLQDCGPDQSLFPGERRQCSTLPPGADIQSLQTIQSHQTSQTGLFYRGRVTAPRPQASAHQPASPPGSHPEPQTPASRTQRPQDPTPEEELYRQGQVSPGGPGLVEQHHQQDSGSRWSEGLSRQLNGALQRAGSGQGSGKSASAEDLLERLEERQMTTQHHRSRSSPVMERPNQDFPPGELRMFGVFSEAGRRSLPNHRATDTQVAGRPVSPQQDQISLNLGQFTGLVQDPSNPPITRRERQRNGDRQRALSASTLAASVGLPCPFSPPGAPGSNITEWQASERLSQANLDAITFPCTLRTGGVGDSDSAASDRSGSGSRGASSFSEGEGGVRGEGRKASQSSSEHLDQDGSPDPLARHRLCNTSESGETLREIWNERAFSLGSGEGECAERSGIASPKTPSPQPHVLPSASPHVLPSASPHVLPSPSPHVLPSASPHVLPSPSPHVLPSASPHVLPSPSPHVLPSASPHVLPSASPHVLPSPSPHVLPSASPHVLPSASPHVLPSASPHRKDKPPSPSPFSPPSTQGREKLISSLRISESSLSSPVILSEASVGLDNFNEVFLQHPAPPSPPPPIRETDIMEDFPPPPPLSPLCPPTLLELVQDVGQQNLGSLEYLDNPVVPSSSLFPPHMPSLLLPVTTPSGLDPQEAEDDLGLEHQLLHRRERSTEDDLALEYQQLPRRERSTEDDLGLEYQPLPRRERSTEDDLGLEYQPLPRRERSTEDDLGLEYQPLPRRERSTEDDLGLEYQPLPRRERSTEDDLGLEYQQLPRRERSTEDDLGLEYQQLPRRERSSEDDLGLEYQPLPRRERSSEDDLGLEYQQLPRRERSSEELRVEALARQLVLQDRSLAPLLDTWRGKTTVDLMEDIFHSTGLGGKSPLQRRGSSRLDDRVQDGICPTAVSPEEEREVETDLDEEEKDVHKRKVLLCEALRLSAAALRQEKEVLAEEQRRHRVLGSSLEILVQDRCKINEKDKYRMFIGDLERIVNLLLSLCSRLARIDKALLDQDQTLEDAAEERESLHHKRSQLLSQTEDARELKENLDRRQRVVQGILSGYLTAAQLHDYQRFVSVKPSLLIRQRQLDDLIRQGEEQLSRLAESLPPEMSGWWGSPSPSSPTPSPCPFPSLLPGSAPSVRSTTVTSL